MEQLDRTPGEKVSEEEVFKFLNKYSTLFNVEPKQSLSSLSYVDGGELIKEYYCHKKAFRSHSHDDGKFWFDIHYSEYDNSPVKIYFYKQLPISLNEEHSVAIRYFKQHGHWVKKSYKRVIDYSRRK